MSDLLSLITTLTAARDKEMSVTLSHDQLALLIEQAAEVREAMSPRISETLLIDIDEICAELRTSRQTIWKLRKRGAFIPEVVSGSRKKLFLREDFKRWLSQKAV